LASLSGGLSSAVVLIQFLTLSDVTLAEIKQQNPQQNANIDPGNFYGTNLLC